MPIPNAQHLMPAPPPNLACHSPTCMECLHVTQPETQSHHPHPPRRITTHGCGPRFSSLASAPPSPAAAAALAPSAALSSKKINAQSTIRPPSRRSLLACNLSHNYQFSSAVLPGSGRSISIQENRTFYRFLLFYTCPQCWCLLTSRCIIVNNARACRSVRFPGGYSCNFVNCSLGCCVI